MQAGEFAVDREEGALAESFAHMRHRLSKVFSGHLHTRLASSGLWSTMSCGIETSAGTARSITRGKEVGSSGNAHIHVVPSGRPVDSRGANPAQCPLLQGPKVRAVWRGTGGLTQRSQSVAGNLSQGFTSGIAVLLCCISRLQEVV